ncbi:MAG TPA: DUF47 family protein [Spirochaetia bacterium]|nr:DUF47 family protein [Spirochaetia bacterium]
MAFNLFDLLLPKEGKFFTLLERQASLLTEAAQTFKAFLAQLEDLSEDEIKKRLWIIRDLELKADEVETTIIDELHKTFITPLDREDIHGLTVRIDGAVDGIHSAARKIGTYHIKKASSRVCRFSDFIVDASVELQTLLGLLRTKGVTYASIERIHQIEGQADDLFYECMADLFAKEDNAVKIFKLKELYESLEAVVDSLDDVAKSIRGIVVKQG